MFTATATVLNTSTYKMEYDPRYCGQKLGRAIEGL